MNAFVISMWGMVISIHLWAIGKSIDQVAAAITAAGAR